ncbi:PD-(D/E)XK nuclease family protein [Kamptonema cortianum]|nr:PD-(D/E)XK nuclease family protein [Geitlerinema splendidum]MDK3158701.1 PD-(D/E)XK nuclease family protein [Kamptonema cortianum]
MARKPTLSPSKITTYLACPVKYRWTYVDARGKWYIRSKSYYSFGSTLHAVLQRFHDEQDKGVTTTHEAIAALEESWIEAGYESQDEMMQAMAEGKSIVQAYVERHEREPVTAKTLMVEKLLRMDLGEFTLIGRLDRVDEREDGTIEVVDYKSGRQTVDAEDIKTDLAMSCYQLLLAQEYPGRNVAATIVALRSGDKATYSMSQEELAAFRQDIEFIGNEILDRDFENLSPVAKPLCLHCDFQSLCKKSEGFVDQLRAFEPAQA